MKTMKSMQTLLQTVTAAIAAVALASVAIGQSFNFTVSTSSGPGSIVPSDLFGGAAGQPGYWHSHVGTINQGVPVPLVDINGDATGVTMTSSNQFFALNSSANLPGATRRSARPARRILGYLRRDRVRW
jgi:hypothetical protein